jgi:DNA-binding transcriptional ArsR family regulator
VQSDDGKTWRSDVLLSLQKIEDTLEEIVQILKAQSSEMLETSKRRLLSGSPLRRKIYAMCDGRRSVTQIARTLRKSLQQISNNVALLENAGLIRVVRRGKEKYYVKSA